MVDIAIVGKGPAGWSCAMTARLRGLSATVIAPREDITWLRRAERIENYPGLPQVSGSEMLHAFARQALALGAKEREGLVRQIMPNGNAFMLLVENDVLESRTVVLATGAARPSLLPGEEAAVGRGISYCATCDGMFYKGKRVAVLSATGQGAEETEFLAKIATEVDYYFLQKHSVEALGPLVRPMPGKPVGIEQRGRELAVKTSEGEVVYDGVFIFRAAMPLDLLLSELHTEEGFIATDRMMRTNIPGLFAAGDCAGRPLQIAKAVGEGNIAAISAAEYLSKHG